MNHIQQPHPSSSFGEFDLLRFVFELHQQQVDPIHLQQMIFDHNMRSQIEYSALTPPPEVNQGFSSPTATSFKPSHTSTSTPSMTKLSSSQIPEPKVVFNYIPSTRLPTPEPEDIGTKSIDEDESGTDKLLYTDKITEWCGHSLYHNLPDVTMVEYDKLLRESHTMKMEVISKLHNESPINYDYNPNKSRIRTNYGNPMIAEGRTKNNIASRRSRQRKKFQQHILQYSVDFDEDENYLLQKQETWLRAIIENLERKIMENEEIDGADEIDKLRKQNGFK